MVLVGIIKAIPNGGNDALLEVFYEQMVDAFPADYGSAIYIFHGSYDVPLKAKDKRSHWIWYIFP